MPTTTVNMILTTIDSDGSHMVTFFQNAIVNELTMSDGDRNVETVSSWESDNVDMIAPISNYEVTMSFTIAPINENGEPNMLQKTLSENQYNKILNKKPKTSQEEFAELAEMIDNE